MFTNLLMKPSINTLISKLDDSHSMFSVATRDFVDNAGRTAVEWKRSPDGGRERLIEEGITTLIWGFGINFMKEWVYDPLVKKITPIAFPDLDMQVLNPKHAQYLPEGVLKPFAQKHPAIYGKLQKVLESPLLQKQYHISNVAKFALCTFAPIALLAFGVPRMNQWLTRNIVAKRTPQKQTGPQFGTVAIHRPAAFNAFEQHQKGLIQGTFKHPLMFAGGGFGGGIGNMVAETASMFLQNERANTLLVDGTLSTGRTYSARNWLERLEIIFRESSIIFFLFYAQRPVQNWIQKMTDKVLGTVSQMEFYGLKHLAKQAENPAFDLAKSHGQGVSEIVKGLQAKLPGVQNIEGLLASNDHKVLAQLEKPMTELIREYALAGKQDNLIFEMAKSLNWIQTLPAKEGEAALIDLTKLVNTKAMPHLFETLATMAQKLEKNAGQTVSSLVKKSYGGRFSAMILANLVCAFFVAYLCPKIQHWITYKLTGKDYFPGVDTAKA